MKKILSILFLFLAFSCSGKVNSSNKSINTASIIDVDSLNPYQIVSSTSEEILFNVYEGLVKPAPNSEVVPAIAKSYSISEDGLTYNFEIRDDVYFHNGTKLEVNDVVFSLNKMIELKLQKNFSNIEKVSSSEQNVQITLKKPDSSLIYYLITPIVDEQTFDNLVKEANGTGPYMVSEYQREQKIVLKKFDKYYGEKANIETINIDILPNFESSFLKILSSEYNFLSGINSKRVNEVKDKKIISNPRNMLFILGINNEKYDINIRKALNAAIDKDDFITKVVDGQGTKLGIDEKVDMSILNGMSFVLKAPVNDRIYTDAAQVIKEQLSKYGVKIEIQAIEWSTWLQEVYTDRNFELTLIGFTGKLDKDATYRRYVSDYKRNFSNFNNEEYDKLINDAKLTIDTAKRNELYKKAQEIIYKNYASIFLMDPSIIVVMDNDIDGYVQYTIPFIDFSKLNFKD